MRRLAEVAIIDRRTAAVHTVAQLGIAIGFGLLIGPWPVALWFLVSLLQLRLGAAVTRALLRRDVRWAAAWSIANIFLANVMIAALAWLAARQAGSWGLLNGEMLLMCLVINAATLARKHYAASLAALAPPAASMILLAILALQHGDALGGAVTMAIGTFGAILFALDAQRQMAAGARAAEAANDAKGRFLALVSHELRTPLSGILATATKLADATPKHRDGLDAALIVDSARMMRTLLDDLLDLSKVEAGQMIVESMAFDLRSLIHDTARFWRAQVRAKGLRMRLAGARSAPAWVCGDPTRLRQILNNLISNAVKFTEAGTITIRVSWAPQGAGAGALTFEVEDTGPGMHPEQIRRLFRPYEQGLASTARTHGGTGLGLALSRELARRMDGDLVARAEPGVGSIFELRLPGRIAEPPPLDHAAPARAGPPARDAVWDSPVSKARCLVVDDHVLNRRAMQAILEPLVGRLALAESGAAALEMLGREPFDIVLMDLHMPGMDGREATRRLRQSGPNRAVPVLALTGATSEAETRSCAAAGMTGFVQKPVELSQLLSALTDALDGAAPMAGAQGMGRPGR